MKKLLHIDSSVLGPHSVSRQLSAAIVDRLRQTTPDIQMTYRDLSATPLTHLSGAHLAAAQGATNPDAALAQELAAGQAVLEIAVSPESDGVAIAGELGGDLEIGGIVAVGGPGPVLAALIGVNLGPNLTYTGSLATLLWRRVLRHHGSSPDLGEFTRLGLLTVPAGLVIGVLALWAGLHALGG